MIFRVRLDVFLLAYLSLVGFAYSVFPQAIKVLGFSSLAIIASGLLNSTESTKGIKKILAGVVSLPFPHSLLLFLLLLTVFTVKRPAIKKTGSTIVLAVFIGYSLLLSIFGMEERFGLSILFWMSTFLSGWILFLLYVNKFDGHKQECVAKFFINIMTIEIIIGIIQYIFASTLNITGADGVLVSDSVKGSFGDAHVFGFFLTGYIFYIFYMLFKGQAFIRHLLLLPILVVLVTLTDAKIVIASATIGFMSFSLIMGFSVKRLPIKLLSFSLGVFVAYLFSWGVESIKQSATYEFVAINYIENEFSKKPLFIDRSINQFMIDDPVHWYLGVGPGQFGSLANEILSSDVLYTSKSYHVPLASTWTKMYMSDVGDRAFREEIHGNHSFVLSNYYSGMMAVKNESGLIGFLLFCTVCLAVIFGLVKSSVVGGNSVKVIGLRVMLGTIFIGVVTFSTVDPTFEMSQLMNPLLLLVALMTATSFQQSPGNVPVIPPKTRGAQK